MIQTLEDIPATKCPNQIATDFFPTPQGNVKHPEAKVIYPKYYKHLAHALAHKWVSRALAYFDQQQLCNRNSLLNLKTQQISPKLAKMQYSFEFL